MFTGIIEEIGEITDISEEGTNVHFSVRSSMNSELKVDQSVSHEGVCLTVTELNLPEKIHIVTAVKETLSLTNLSSLKVGSFINLERCVRADARMDGHFVQGHVDQVAECTGVKEVNGSWEYSFSYEPTDRLFLVKKGSVCLNGASLTVSDCHENRFNIAIIPYTYEYTTFKYLKAGDQVNLEFDIIGKYLSELYYRNKD